jgi:hypothetical protein
MRTLTRREASTYASTSAIQINLVAPLDPSTTQYIPRGSRRVLRKNGVAHERANGVG